MKKFNLKNVSVIFLLFISCAASLLMGCSGGGGGGGGATTVVPGFTPTALTAGKVITITGNYIRRNLSLSADFTGTCTKILTITSPTTAILSGSFTDSGGGISSTYPSTAVTLVYTQSSATNAKIRATNYVFNSDVGSIVTGVVEVQLIFGSANTGSYNEVLITGVSPYSGSGTFTLN